MIPIPGLTMKCHALENSHEVNCQFDICSCECMLISFFKTFQAIFNPGNCKCPPFSLLCSHLFDYPYVSKNVLSKLQRNKEMLKFCRPHEATHTLINN